MPIHPINHPVPPPDRVTRFGYSGKIPLSVIFQNNEVINRGFIDVFGDLPAAVFVARNFYEKLERAFDELSWIGFALAAPLMIEKSVSQHFSNKLRANPQFAKYFNKIPAAVVPENLTFLQRLNERIGLWGKHSLFQAPWGSLDKHVLHTMHPEKAAEMAKNMGFKSVEAMKSLMATPVFRNKILNGKLVILLVDLMLIAFNGYIASWGKNLMTAMLSGKKGFSGVFNYANDNYRENATKDYEENKRKRLILSGLGTMVGTLLSLPLLIAGTLALKGKNVFSLGMKKMLPMFDYSNAIFMSKWVMLWASLSSWVLNGALAARDKNERREHLIRAFTGLTIYTVGDDILSGITGKLLEKYHPVVKASGISLTKRMPIGIRTLAPLEEILAKVGGNTENIVYKLAKRTYWGNLLATTALVATVMPLVNNWFTKKKVLEEQDAQNKTSSTQAQLQKVLTHPALKPAPDITAPGPKPPIPIQSLNEGKNLQTPLPVPWTFAHGAHTHGASVSYPSAQVFGQYPQAQASTLAPVFYPYQPVGGMFPDPASSGVSYATPVPLTFGLPVPQMYPHLTFQSSIPGVPPPAFRM